MNCTELYNSKKVQKMLSDAWKKEMAYRVKNGGLEEGAWAKYKKGFKKGFMRTCKNKAITARKSKRSRNTKKQTH